MKLKLYLPVVLLSGLLLASCGGSDDEDKNISNLTFDGVTTQATVTTENSDELAVASTAGAGQAIAEEKARATTGFRPSPEKAFLLDFSEKLKQLVTTANRTANQAIPGLCSSGSADITFNEDQTHVTMVYNNCVVADSDGEIVNGTVILNSDSGDSYTNFSLQYIDFTVTIDGETYSMDMTMVCTESGCTWNSDFEGPDGRTYRTENANVSFDGSGYSVSATVYDPDYGYIAISGDVSMGSCSNGMPYPGSITYTGSGGSTGSVTYDSCEQFTVTVDGVSTTYNWADILN